MSLPSAPRDPERVRRTRHHFGYTGCECGQKWHAFIAGKPLWLYLHGSQWSKPCCEKITGGELSCDYCNKGVEKIVKGYVPVWRDADHKPCTVIVWEEIRDVVDALPLHSRAIVGRGKSQRDPIYIARAMNQEPPFRPVNAEMMAAADVTESALRLLKCPELTAWYRQTHGAKSDNAVSLPSGTAVTDSGEPYSPLLQAAAKRAGADVIPPAGPVETGETVQEFLRGVQAGTIRPSANGRHKIKRG